MEDIRLDKQGCRYEDMVELPHPVSEKHPRMARKDRAAQFAPFAALNGFEAALDKTAQKVMEDTVHYGSVMVFQNAGRK